MYSMEMRVAAIRDFDCIPGFRILGCDFGECLLRRVADGFLYIRGVEMILDGLVQFFEK
jgi:hypothetical protein